MKANQPIYILVVCIIFSFAIPSFADSFTSKTMRTLTKEDGLTGETVSSIVKDKSGLV